MKFWTRVLGMCLTTALALGSAFAAEGDGKTLGIMWIGKSGMANRVLSGLEAQLKAKAPGLKIEIQKELADDAAAAPVYEKWMAEKDGVVFLRSNGAKFLGKNPPSKPAFVGGCNNPVTLGALKSMEAPDGNVTGVTYYLEAAQQLKLYKSMLPGIKSIGLLLEEGHPGTAIDQASTKKACGELGLAYNELVLTKGDDIAAKVKELAGTVDLLIIGNESLVIDGAEAIAGAAGDTPVASYAEKPITKKHALVGLVPSDEKLGRVLGDSVVEVVVNGTAVADVPVKTDDKPRILICAEKMQQWKIKPPLQLMKMAELIK